jgi:hypothetical protein
VTARSPIENPIGRLADTPDALSLGRGGGEVLEPGVRSALLAGRIVTGFNESSAP